MNKLDLYVQNNSDVLSFKSQETEPVIKITEDGKFYYKGKLVTKDIEVYKALRQFLIDCKYIPLPISKEAPPSA